MKKAAMNNKEKQALAEHVKSNKQHYHDKLVDAFKDSQRFNEQDTWNRGTYVCVDADGIAYTSDISENEYYLDARTWNIDLPECIAYVPAWYAECEDAEAAARADGNVDLTDYDKAVEASETIYDEPDFYAFMEEHYPDKFAEYDKDAADMRIYAFADSDAWDYIDQFIDYLEGNL